MFEQTQVDGHLSRSGQWRIFFMNLTMESVQCISGGAMWSKTDSHGTGVDLIVPEIVLIVELRLQSIKCVCTGLKRT